MGSTLYSEKIDVLSMILTWDFEKNYVLPWKFLLEKEPSKHSFLGKFLTMIQWMKGYNLTISGEPLNAYARLRRLCNSVMITPAKAEQFLKHIKSLVDYIKKGDAEEFQDAVKNYRGALTFGKNQQIVVVTSYSLRTILLTLLILCAGISIAVVVFRRGAHEAARVRAFVLVLSFLPVVLVLIPVTLPDSFPISVENVLPFVLMIILMFILMFVRRLEPEFVPTLTSISALTTILGTTTFFESQVGILTFAIISSLVGRSRCAADNPAKFFPI